VFTIKTIDNYFKNIIDDLLNEELLELGNYISKKTLCNLISAYQTMLPTALKAKSGTIISKKYETYIVIDKNCEVKTEKQKQIVEFFSLYQKEIEIIEKIQQNKKKLVDFIISKEFKE